jgi:hypothetical protein
MNRDSRDVVHKNNRTILSRIVIKNFFNLQPRISLGAHGISQEEVMDLHTFPLVPLGRYARSSFDQKICLVEAEKILSIVHCSTLHSFVLILYPPYPFACAPGLILSVFNI